MLASLSPVGRIPPLRRDSGQRIMMDCGHVLALSDAC